MDHPLAVDILDDRAVASLARDRQMQCRRSILTRHTARKKREGLGLQRDDAASATAAKLFSRLAPKRPGSTRSGRRRVPDTWIQAAKDVRNQPNLIHPIRSRDV